MTQLQHMDARQDTLSTELYQVNIRIDRIARWQATIVASNSDPEDNDDDDGDDDDASDDDGDASSIDEMST